MNDWDFRNSISDLRYLEFSMGSGANFGIFYFDSISLEESEIIDLNISNFEITANSLFDNSSLTNFSAYLNGTLYSTTNGTIITSLLQNETNLFNITVNATNHFNSTYLNYNVSSNLIANLSQHPVVNIFDLYDNSSLVNFSVEVSGVNYTDVGGEVYIPFNFTGVFTIFKDDYFSRVVNGTLSSDNSYNYSLFGNDITFYFRFSNGDLVPTPINFTDLNNSIFYNVTNGTKNIFPSPSNITFSVRCDAEVFAPFNVTLEFLGKENKSINLTVSETQTVLTFYDVNTSLPISDANLTVFYPSGSSEVLVTNSSGSINFSYIHLNVTEFGTYNFSLSRLGFVPLSFSEVINSSTIPFSKSYNVSRATLIVNIYDRDTGSLLTESSSVDFVGVFNESTSTGTLTKNNLSIISGEYIIYVSSEGYRTESRTFDFTNQEVLTLNFYLLNLSESNYGTVLITTQDSYFREIVGASCDMLEYVPSELSFVSVSNCVTNNNAECTYAVELNEKTYYVRCTTFIGDELFIAETNNNGEIFTINNDIRNLIFFTRADFEVSSVDNLYWDIDESFSEVTNVSSISVDFNSYDGTSITMCVEYFKLVNGDYVSETGDLYCLDSTSAIQNIGVSVTLNRSNSYKAVVYVKNGGNKPLDTFYYPSVSSADEVFEDYVKGALLLFLYIGILAVALHLENIIIYFIGVIALSWISFFVFPLYVIIQASAYKTIISLIAMYVARKRKDFV